jgi:hypothetical protein
MHHPCRAQCTDITYASSRPFDYMDIAIHTVFLWLFWKHVFLLFSIIWTHFVTASVSLNFDTLKFNWVIDIVIYTWKSQFYDFRYQFRAFGSRFEHFKVQKMLQEFIYPFKKILFFGLIWAHCQFCIPCNWKAWANITGGHHALDKNITYTKEHNDTVRISSTQILRIWEYLWVGTSLDKNYSVSLSRFEIFTFQLVFGKMGIYSNMQSEKLYSILTALYWVEKTCM